MVDLKVPVNVLAPSSIDVPLVRGDHLKTSSVFRIGFEVALALFAAGLGAVFAGEELGTFGRAFLIVTGIAAGVFLWLSIRWQRRARIEGEEG